MASNNLRKVKFYQVTDLGVLRHTALGYVNLVATMYNRPLVHDFEPGEITEDFDPASIALEKASGQSCFWRKNKRGIWVFLPFGKDADVYNFSTAWNDAEDYEGHGGTKNVLAPLALQIFSSKLFDGVYPDLEITHEQWVLGQIKAGAWR